MRDTIRQRTVEDVWESLRDVRDPEIPVLSLVDLGVVRSVSVAEDSVHVVLAPTFSGCPAMELMRRDVEEKLESLGFTGVNVELNRSLAWTSDLMNDTAREVLRNYGIVPPPPRGQESLSQILSLPVRCPFCGSDNTNLESPFGPTLCKQIFYCGQCRQSFERFKPL